MMDNTLNWQVSLSNPNAIVEGVEDIAQCVYNILATVKGSDPLRADFGSDVYLYIDKPMNEIQPLLAYAVTESLQKWEKRIKVKKVRLVSSGLDKRTIVIEAEVIASASQIQLRITN
jgi:phage baseplate assembly protein W